MLCILYVLLGLKPLQHAHVVCRSLSVRGVPMPETDFQPAEYKVKNNTILLGYIQTFLKTFTLRDIAFSTQKKNLRKKNNN